VEELALDIKSCVVSPDNWRAFGMTKSTEFQEKIHSTIKKSPYSRSQ